MGFNPRPSLTSTEFTKKGLEVKIINNPKRTWSEDCISSVDCLNFKFKFLVKEKKNPYTDRMESHKSIEPSWFPHVPEILYIKGLSEWEFWKTLKLEKSDII